MSSRGEPSWSSSTRRPIAVHDVLGRSSGVRAEHLLELTLAEREVAAPQLDRPVRVEEEQLAGRELRPAILEPRTLEHTDQRARRRDALDAPVGAQDQRRRVAACGEGERRRLVARADAHAEHGAERPALAHAPAHRLVEEREVARRRALAQRRRVQGVPCQRREPGRLRALARDVADDRGPDARLGREDVVEVASHLVLIAGCAIAGRDVEPGDLRQLGRQQALLQRVGDVGALRVEARVLDVQAGARRQGDRDDQVGRGEAAVGPGEPERDRPEDAPGRLHRHRQRRAQPELAQPAQVLLVGRGRGKQLVGRPPPAARARPCASRRPRPAGSRLRAPGAPAPAARARGRRARRRAPAGGRRERRP